MPTILTVEDAINKADAFVSRYHMFKKLLSAQRIPPNAWVLEYDVGVLIVDKIRLKIDGDSGAIVEFARVA
jgi:hypothetical protein